jgi:hypothetical protein
LIDIRNQHLKHADVEEKLIHFKREFGALVRQHCFIAPNTGQMPSSSAKFIEILPSPTSEEQEIQDVFDQMIDNLTILNALCCRVYPKWFSSHFL